MQNIIFKWARFFFIRKRAYAYNIQFDKRRLFYEPVDMMNFPKYFFLNGPGYFFIRKRAYTYNIQFDKIIFFYKEEDMINFQKYSF